MNLLQKKTRKYALKSVLALVIFNLVRRFGSQDEETRCRGTKSNAMHVDFFPGKFFCPLIKNSIPETYMNIKFSICETKNFLKNGK
jgi:hypothetical protein